MQDRRIYERLFKRPLDIILSLTALTILSPLFVLITLLVRIKLGSPIIFKQDRPGLNERLFELYKFRTMTNEKDSYGIILSDGDRLTKFGRFLRSASLDELPSLINILKGEMSLVGPRPQLIRDLIFMNENARKRQTVRPGLTGLAQINGRNIISWEDKFDYDLKYISNIKFISDIKIIFLTIIKVIKRSGIVSHGFDTAEDYGDYLLRTKKINKEVYDAILKNSSELN